MTCELLVSMPQGYGCCRGPASPGGPDMNGSSVPDHDCEEIMAQRGIAQYPRRLGPSIPDVPAGVGGASNAGATSPSAWHEPPPGPDLSHREDDVDGR
jgi:hypothetical protein